MEIYQINKYDPIKSYIVCYPVKFDITDKSNKHYGNVDFNNVFSQYNKFINELILEGIKIQFLDIGNSPEQVYTRDLAFVIKDTIFICNMQSVSRKTETSYLLKFVKENNLKYYEMKNNIEGGDVIPYDDVVFVGISTRTTIEATNELQEVLKEKDMNVTVVPINFDAAKIHLDCAFNTLDKGEAVISPYVYDRKIIEKYIKKLYDISKEDADNLGTNFIYLGHRRVLSCSEKITKLLNDNGYKAKYIDFSEIAKGEGGFECATLSILREK